MPTLWGAIASSLSAFFTRVFADHSWELDTILLMLLLFLVLVLCEIG